MKKIDAARLRTELHNYLHCNKNKQIDKQMDVYFEEFCHEFICKGWKTGIQSRTVGKDGRIHKRSSATQDLPGMIKFDKLILSVDDLIKCIANSDNAFKENWKNNEVYFKTASSHPTIDSLSIKFNESLVKQKVTFYNITNGEKHDLNINKTFVDYLIKLSPATFEFVYITTENNYANFYIYQSPKDSDEFNAKIKELNDTKARAKKASAQIKAQKDIDSFQLAWQQYSSYQLLEFKFMEIKNDFLDNILTS